MEGVQPRQLELRSRNVFFDKTKRGRGHVKHSILKRYLQAWFPKLAFNQNTSMILYVDGFAGRGKHVTSAGIVKPGSPLVAYKTAVEHKYLTKWNAEIVMLFIEKDPQNAEALKATMLEEGHFVGVRWHVICGNFADYMEHICQLSGFPMFIFADPFGYSGEVLPMTLMQQLAHRPFTDISINVMDSFALQWGVNQERNTQLVSGLLGIDQEYWEPLLCQEGLTPDKKRERFMDLYKSGLRMDISNEMYFLKFGIRRGNNTHVYHLLFATKHRSGIVSMKYAMWEQTQESSDLIFSEFKENKGMVEIKENEVAENMIEAVKEKFNGEMVTGEDIGEFVLLKTLYQVKKNPLKVGLKEFIAKKPAPRAFNDIVYQF